MDYLYHQTSEAIWLYVAISRYCFFSYRFCWSWSFPQAVSTLTFCTSFTAGSPKVYWSQRSWSPIWTSRFVAAEQPWPNPVEYKIWGYMSTRQKRKIWTIWGSIWLTRELEWNRALSMMALTSDADVSMSAFEPQEYILTIHCDIY